MAHGVVGHHGAHLDRLCARQVVHPVEEGLEDHPEVLDRLVVPVATLLRFAVARIGGEVESLLFLVESLRVVAVRIRVEVVLVRETFGEEEIVDQEKIGVGRVHLGVVASMVVGRAMAIVDEVEIGEEERTDVVHLDELERIVAVAICDQVSLDVSRLLRRRLEEMAIEGVRQTIAWEDLVDRGKVHGAVGIVAEEIGDEEIHRASRRQVMAIVDDPCLLVVGSGHRLVAVGFFAAFSPHFLPLLVEHPLFGALLLQPRFLFVDGLRLLPLFDGSLPFGILRAILRVFQRFGLAFAARV